MVCRQSCWTTFCLRTFLPSLLTEWPVPAPPRPSPSGLVPWCHLLWMPVDIVLLLVQGPHSGSFLFYGLPATVTLVGDRERRWTFLAMPPDAGSFKATPKRVLRPCSSARRPRGQHRPDTRLPPGAGRITVLAPRASAPTEVTLGPLLPHAASSSFQTPLLLVKATPFR
uniref:Uncharacterized protein n=1 Tax=Molossus molossus TaxID=27622 RepID=A0A7J8I9L9_MOLMO|nr:hypothetical protein HJG59_010724 [Molossus molossus]